MTNLKILISHFGVINENGYNRTFPLAFNLGELGHDVTLITTQKKIRQFPYKKKNIGKIRIISFPEILPRKVSNLGFGFMSLILKCLYILNKKYDIVFADTGHRPSSGFPCLLHRSVKKSKFITEWWDFYGKGGQYENKPLIWKLLYGKIDNYLELNIRKKADGVTVLSNYTYHRARKISISPEKLRLIYGGADITNISYISDYNFRKCFNLPLKAFIFCIVGLNSTEIKNIIPFLEAIQKLKHKYNVVWFSTGSRVDESIKKTYNIGNEYFHFGWLDYKSYVKLLSCANVFLLLHENNLINIAKWPNKIGDYLSAGRCILTNPVGEIVHIKNKLPDSILFTKEDFSDLIEKIEFMLLRKQKIHALGKKNRTFAENGLSWYRQASLLEDFFYSILSKK